MKYYVVIDTNVLVSAVLKSHSVPGSIVELAFDGPIIPILNEAIEKEYREVLSRPKFHLPEDLIEGIMSTFHKRAIYVDAEHLDIKLPDPKDLVFYEVVMEERKGRCLSCNRKYQAFPKQTLYRNPSGDAGHYPQGPGFPR